jgi:hypothetical protein
MTTPVQESRPARAGSPEDGETTGRRLLTRARRIVRHEWTIAAVVASVLSLLLNRDALKDLSHTLPSDVWDPSLNAYAIAWGGHALLHNPTGIWHTNAFYPASYSLAYSDSLLAYAPFAIIGTGPEVAVARYNVLFIVAQAMVFFGGYVLARQLGLRPVAATLAGVAVAVAPWRLSQTGHIQVLSYGGMFLALAMLARGHGVRWLRREGEEVPHRPWWALGGWLVATWQLCIGFGVGVPFLYVLLGCLVVGVVIWWRRRRPWPSRRLLGIDLAGGLLFAGTGALLALPYLKVLDLYPYARRDASWVALYSPPLSGLFTAPEQSWLWGEAHAGARSVMSIPNEMAVLPGFALYALAAAGLFFSVWSVRVRLGLATGAVVTLIFCLGTNGPADGHLGYRLLLHLPGFEGIRTPARLVIWSTLLLALLAAGCVAAMERDVTAWLARRREAPSAVRDRPHLVATTAVAVALLPTIAVYAEGRGTLLHARVPDPPAALATVEAPYLVLPMHQVMDMPIMLWSTDRFADLVNGGSGMVPREQDEIRAAVAHFPDQASTDALRAIGVRTVVVLRGWAAGGAYADADTVEIAGLPLTRQVYSDVVVFTLAPS